MQVDLRIPSSKPVAEIVSFAQRCEDAGFSGLGFVDSHTFLRDVYVVMAQVLRILNAYECAPLSPVRGRATPR